MSSQNWVQTIITAQAAGAALSNSAVAASILPSQAKFTLPTNTIDVIGKMLRIKAQCDVSNIVTTPGTLTLDIRFGGTVVFTSGAIQLNTTANTTLPVSYEIILTARSVGSAATLMGQGWAMGVPLGTGAAVGVVPLPATAPAVGTSFDSTAVQQIDHFATFSIANAGNLIQLQQFSIELMN
jgi:hypothetical protein